MNNQAIIENLLDMWLSEKQLEAIQEDWKAFYRNPSAYKNTPIVEMVKQYVLDSNTYNNEDSYCIPRCRLEELATQFKDGLLADDRVSAMEFFNEECKMSSQEKEYFGVESEESEDEYIPSSENGDYSPSNPWDAPGMSIRDFI